MNEYSTVTEYKINPKTQLFFYIPAMNMWTLKLKI